MVKKVLMSLMFAMCALSVSAGTVIFDGSSPDAWADNRVSVQDGLMVAQLGFRPLFSTEAIPVIRGRKYTVSGEFRVIGKPQGRATLYFGITPFTADGQEIIHAAVATAEPQLITTLAADAKKGDKVLILNNAANWKFLAHGRLAFNAREDRSDLPNMDLSPFFDMNNIKVREDGSVEVALKQPLAKDYPAGTKVRQHRSGNAFVYVGISDKSDEWVSFSQTFNNFYIGTAKIKLTIRLLQRQWPVEIRNIRVIAE